MSAKLFVSDQGWRNRGVRVYLAGKPVRPSPWLLDGWPMPRIVFDEIRLQAADERLRNWATTGVLPAVSVAVGSADSTEWTAAYGRQTLDGERPVDPHSIFLIASPTKPITAL